ncbi:MAG: galactose mutarotase [Lachnospiraceae bacterium]|nr:galactose mutarotase [Lachnospiraceae bacterium]
MIEKKYFGKTLDNEKVTLFTISNKNGMKASVTDFGAILTSLIVPNDKGAFADVVLGYDRAKDYFVNGSFFGATIGPVANRTKDATFELDGTIYNLTVNDNANNLHSDFHRALHKVLWNATIKESENAITFRTSSPDGYLGFPGNRDFSVTYALSEDNALSISYKATTDKTTVINLTNHSYFNLKGHDCEQTIEDEVVWINASGYTPVVMGAIPTGEIAPVAGTPFDFKNEKAIGRDIGQENAQLALEGGYDHNFALDDYEKGKIRLVATLSDKTAGRTMEVYTDLPGLQLYTGNGMEPEIGKEDARYLRRSAVCFETQYFPNSASDSRFERPVVKPGETYATTTIYKFI